jgi:hypothetical protein
MPDRLDPTFVRAQIELLRITHPGIWDDGDEQLLADMLEAETGLFEFLMTLMRRALVDDAAVVRGSDAIVTEFRERRDRYERRIEAARTLAFKLMQQANVRKIELPIATLSIRAGQPRVIITDEAALPENCIRVRKEPDKIAIKEQLAHGEPVPGAELSNSEPVLSVRVK